VRRNFSKINRIDLIPWPTLVFSDYANPGSQPGGLGRPEFRLWPRLTTSRMLSQLIPGSRRGVIMSINLSCEKCGKLYEMPDSVAGKRARCKQCGHEFRIPVPASVARARTAGSDSSGRPRAAGPDSAARSRTAAPDNDPYGLKEAPPRPKPVSYTEEDDLPPPPRMPYKPNKPSKSKSRSSSRREADPDAFKRGLWCMFMGIGIFVLPFFGLQFRWAAFLPEAAQLGIGVLLMTFGSFSLITSGEHPIFGVSAFFATGVGALLFLGVMVAQQGGNLNPGNQGGPPRVAQDGQPPHGGQLPFPGPRLGPGGNQNLPPPTSTPPIAGQEPHPGFPPAGTPPPFPAQGFGGDGSPATGPAPGAGPAPGFPPSNGAGMGNGRAVLSNARMTRDGSVGGRGLSLSVDFRFENGGPQIGKRYCLVLESAGSKSRVRILHMDSQGTITAQITQIGPAQDTSFVAYLAIDTLGGRGRDPQPVSDKVTITVTQGVANGGMAPGMAPGRPRMPRMPRPGFGPPGP
jgi:hypothetical protein